MASKARILRLRPHQFGSIRAPNHRFYHSYDHPSPHPETFTPIEKTILQAAARHIPSHGFTQTTLGLGAKDAGYLDASTNLFPNGAFSLVHYHLLTQRLSLAQRSGILEPLPNGEQLGMGGKVKALTWARLIGNKEVIHRWQEALALMAQPSNLPTSINELSLLSDEIWFLAGDTSVDTSWYTKRASLSTIYATTELFMTTDKSTDFTYTREFMDRRFKDSQILGRAVGSVGQWVGFTAHAGLNVLRSKGVRI